MVDTLTSRYIQSFRSQVVQSPLHHVFCELCRSYVSTKSPSAEGIRLTFLDHARSTHRNLQLIDESADATSQLVKHCVKLRQQMHQQRMFGDTVFSQCPCCEQTIPSKHDLVAWFDHSQVEHDLDISTVVQRELDSNAEVQRRRDELQKTRAWVQSLQRSHELPVNDPCPVCNDSLQVDPCLDHVMRHLQRSHGIQFQDVAV